MSADRGSVTAEFAAALPAVIVLLALCLSALHLTTVQVRVQDAAALAARVTARGESGAGAGLVGSLVPGADLSIETRGELVCATVVASGGSGPFAGVQLSGRSCAPSSLG